MRSRIINMTVPAGLLKEIDELAREEGRTRSDLFREAARHYVEDHRWVKKDSANLLTRLASLAVKGPGRNPEDLDRVLYGRRRR